MKETIAKINEVMAVLQAELAKAQQGSCSTRTQSNSRTRETRKRVPQAVYHRAQVVRQDTNTTVPARPLSCGNLLFYSIHPILAKK